MMMKRMLDYNPYSNEIDNPNEDHDRFEEMKMNKHLSIDHELKHSNQSIPMMKIEMNMEENHLRNEKEKEIEEERREERRTILWK